MSSSLPSTPSFLKSKASATPPALTLAAASAGHPTPSASLRPPTTDFDAGLNSSAAWAAQRERAADVLSDDESDAGSMHVSRRERGRPARALYAFDGKAEFRELSVRAGDSLEVLRPDAGEGWSLVSCGREVGLLPQSYYIVSYTVYASCSS
jgi:sorting nexin-9/18/33